MARYFSSSHSSMPYFEPSRPMPDSFIPPKGATSVEMNPVLIPTIPYSSASDTRQMRPFTEIPVDEWRQVMDVNVLSMFLTTRAVVPHMREHGGGRVVNISSGTPFRGVAFLLHYVTSKGAIVALTRALAKELGRDDILVNCVAPGFTMSDGVREHPEVIDALRDLSVSARTLQRDQEPEDVVGAVVFLCGPGAEFVTGQTIVIDGGQYFH